MMNKALFTGRLTKDPELRYTPNGVAVCTFTVAVNRNFKNAQGEREADFLQVVSWRQLAELCANYLKKGRLVGVEARIQTRSYDNNEGRKVYVTEFIADDVTFLDSVEQQTNVQQQQTSFQQQPQHYQPQPQQQPQPQYQQNNQYPQGYDEYQGGYPQGSSGTRLF